MTSGCGCTKARGTQCCNQFTREYVTSARETCAELTHSELDVAILGQLTAGTNTSSSLSTGMLSTGRAHHKETERKRVYTGYFHQGKPVCHKMFRFLHNIGEKRLKNLITSFKDNGLRPRLHGNAKKLPHNTLSFHLHNSLFDSSSTMLSSTPFFYQEEFRDTVVQTCNCFHLVTPSGPSGVCTAVQLKQTAASIQWHTAHSLICGGS